MKKLIDWLRSLFTKKELFQLETIGVEEFQQIRLRHLKRIENLKSIYELNIKLNQIEYILKSRKNNYSALTEFEYSKIIDNLIFIINNKNSEHDLIYWAIKTYQNISIQKINF